MEVSQVSLQLRFRGEPPALDRIAYISPAERDAVNDVPRKKLPRAVATALLLLCTHNGATFFRIRTKKASGSLVKTVLNAKRQMQGRSSIRDLANGAFLKLFVKPSTEDGRYFDIDLRRLCTAAIEIIHDGRVITDPQRLRQMATAIADEAGWNVNDYSIETLPKSQGHDSPGLKQQKRLPAKASDIPLCPYRGLFSFWEKDAEVFFGRESLIQLLKEKLEHKHIIQVSGPSGSGKSSLVAAGLIPALKRSDSWQTLYCRPGNDPFGSLASMLMPLLEAGKDEISRAAQLPKLNVLEQGQLCYLLRQVLASDGSRALLLFIDQFEELYTHCCSQALRDSFLDTLLTLMGAGAVANAPQIKLVYTIRADFASRLLSHRRFTDTIQDADVKIGPMNREELDSVISRPASFRMSDSKKVWQSASQKMPVSNQVHCRSWSSPLRNYGGVRLNVRLRTRATSESASCPARLLSERKRSFGA